MNVISLGETTLHFIYVPKRPRLGSSIGAHDAWLLPQVWLNRNFEPQCQISSTSSYQWVWGRHVAQWHMSMKGFSTVVPATDHLD